MYCLITFFFLSFLCSRRWNEEVEVLSKYISDITEINYSNLTFPEKIHALESLRFRHERLLQERLIENESLIGT